MRYKVSVDRRARRLMATPAPPEEANDELPEIQRPCTKVASPAMFDRRNPHLLHTVGAGGRMTEFDVAHNIFEKLARSSGRMHQIERRIAT